MRKHLIKLSAAGALVAAAFMTATPATADPADPSEPQWVTWGPYSSPSQCEYVRDDPWRNTGPGTQPANYRVAGCYKHPSGLIDEWYFNIYY